MKAPPDNTPGLGVDFEVEIVGDFRYKCVIQKNLGAFHLASAPGCREGDGCLRAYKKILQTHKTNYIDYIEKSIQ